MLFYVVKALLALERYDEAMDHLEKHPHLASDRNIISMKTMTRILKKRKEEIAASSAKVASQTDGQKHQDQPTGVCNSVSHLPPLAAPERTVGLSTVDLRPTG